MSEALAELLLVVALATTAWLRRRAERYERQLREMEREERHEGERQLREALEGLAAQGKGIVRKLDTLPPPPNGSRRADTQR